MNNTWRNFNGETWKKSIDVKQFILDNYTEYKGDESFLSGITEKTKRLNDKYAEMSKIEIEKVDYNKIMKRSQKYYLNIK